MFTKEPWKKEYLKWFKEGYGNHIEWKNRWCNKLLKKGAPIETIKNQYDNLVQLRDSRDNNNMQNILRQSFEKDLEFYNGMPDEIVEKMLNKITVEKSDEEGLANLEIMLNIGSTIDVLYKKGKVITLEESIKMASWIKYKYI